MINAVQALKNLILRWKSLNLRSVKCIFRQNFYEIKSCNPFLFLNDVAKKELLYCTTLGFISVGNNKENDPKKESDSKQWKREKDLSKRISEAEKYIKNGDLKEAETILEKALSLNKHWNTAGITVVYDMLATLAYRQKYPNKAVDILEKGIKQLTTNGITPGHNSIVDFRLKLARLNSKLGNNKEAENHFRKCLDIQKLKYTSGIRDEGTVKLWINSLYWFGKHLVLVGRYSEAKQCFDAAYTLCAQAKSIGNDQLMVMLYNLSEMSYATGDKDGALRHLLNALIIGRNTNSPDLPIYYNKIGIVYMSKGALKEAKKWCETGKEKSEKLHNKDAQKEAMECIKKIDEILKYSTFDEV